MVGFLLITLFAGMMTVLTAIVYCAAVTAKRVPYERAALEAHYEAACLSADHLKPATQPVQYTHHEAQELNLSR